MNSSKCYSIAIIGVGQQSRKNHIIPITKCPRFKLVALCDPNLSTLQELKNSLNVNIFEHIDDLIKCINFDVALVAVPHNEYLPIIKILASNKIHILKEKPIATSLKEAKEIKEIIDFTKIKFMISLQRRFDPIFQAFLQLKKELGSIYSISGRYTMNVHRLDSGWRASRKLSGGGALIDMGYHYIDLLLWYFGVPTSVYARMLFNTRNGQKYDVEDTVHLLFEYTSVNSKLHNLVGSLIISRAYPHKSECLEVIGTNGSLELSRGQIRLLSKKGKKIEVIEQGDSWESALLEQLNYFADILDGRRQVSSQDFLDHFYHISIIEAAYRSSSEHRSVFLSELISEN